MKCPNCDYKDGWNWEGDNVDDYKETVGDEGQFWELPVKMEREVRFSYDPVPERQTLYGCPACGMTFIEVQ